MKTPPNTESAKAATLNRAPEKAARKRRAGRVRTRERVEKGSTMNWLTIGASCRTPLEKKFRSTWGSTPGRRLFPKSRISVMWLSASGIKLMPGWRTTTWPSIATSRIRRSGRARLPQAPSASRANNHNKRSHWRRWEARRATLKRRRDHWFWKISTRSVDRPWASMTASFRSTKNWWTNTKSKKRSSACSPGYC